MAGVGNIGCRITLSRSPTQTPKKSLKGKRGSREILCNSSESLSEQSELHQLFPPRRLSSIDVSNYGTIQQIADFREESLGLGDFLGRTIDLLFSTDIDASLSNIDVSNYGTVQQIADFREESLGLGDFLGRTIYLLFSTVFVKLLLLLLSALPVSMLVVGSTYKADCPKEPKLPLYLLVGGGFGLLKILFLFWRQRRLQEYELLDAKSDYTDEESEDLVLSRFVRFTNATLTLFLTIWFAFGNLWFYSIWEPNFAQPLHDPTNWCQGTLFWYFFYHLIVSYVVVGIVLLSLLLIVCFYASHRCCGGDSGVV